MATRSFTKFFILAAFLLVFTIIGIFSNVREGFSSKEFWPVSSAEAEQGTSDAENSKVEEGHDDSFLQKIEDPFAYKLENATFVVLAQNSDLEKMKHTVRTYERRFNSKYHYPWTFFNNKEFTEEFKKTMKSLISGPVEFGTIPTEHWSIPDFIDKEKAKESWKKMEDEHVIYGGSESYRHMCRFESGFFYRQELMQKYRYYWRVEPETSLRCTVNYDVFKFMRERGKRYGFTIAVTEWHATIPTLWDRVKEFISEVPSVLTEGSLLDFISSDGGSTYNKCHFWSNFEIADMEIWRSEEYGKFFESLDKSGGFFYERWGDAPVHSIFVSLYLKAEEIHFFDDIGYSHPPFTHCPRDQGMKELDCDCIYDFEIEFSNDQIDWHPTSCLRTYLNAKKRPYIDGLKGTYDSVKKGMLKDAKEKIEKEKSEIEKEDKMAELKAEIKANLLKEAEEEKAKEAEAAKAKAEAEQEKKNPTKPAKQDKSAKQDKQEKQDKQNKQDKQR